MGRTAITRWLVVVALVGAAASLLPLVRSMLLDQSLTYTTIKSSNDSMAVNYLLALYLYGVMVDRLSRRIGKRKAWLLWGVGLIAIIMTLRLVFGWDMRW